MSERDKLVLETKKEIRSVLLSTKSGVELTRLNKEYEMFTGSKINFRGMGYVSLKAFIDDIPDVARQVDDGYGTITLVAVADETTRHIASLVSRQKGKKKPIRGRFFPGPRLGILSNLQKPRSSYSSRLYGEHHSYSHGWRFTRTASCTNPAASQMAGKLRSSVYTQKGAVSARPAEETSRDSGHRTVVPALRTMVPALKTVAPAFKTVDRDTKTVASLKTEVPELQTRVFHSKTFVPDLKYMLSFVVKRIPVSMPYSAFKKFVEKEFGVKLDFAELGYSSVPEMFSCLGIPVVVKSYCSDDYAILPGPSSSFRNLDKGENQQQKPGIASLSPYSVDRSTVASQSLPPRRSESADLHFQCPASQYSSLSLVSAPPTHCQSGASGPTSRPLSLTSLSSRTASIPDNTKMPSSPSISQELKEAISLVLKSSPDGIPIYDLEAKLKEITGVEINIEETGARCLEHLLVSFPEIILMNYRGNGQLLLFDPGQMTALEDRFDQGRNSVPKDVRASDVDHSGRSQNQKSTVWIDESKSQPRDIPEDSVGPEQVIRTQQLDVGACQYLPVYVSNVISPGHFWFQIDGQPYDLLVDLMETLQRTYNHPNGNRYEMPPSLMKIGQLCAATYLEDNNWHRGTITGFKDSLVQIYYLDYGTTSFVSKDQLRILRMCHLRLPAQAIRARLAKVQPTNGEWSKEAYEFFMERIINKQLMALITNITQDGLVSVCLTDTNGDEDVHLNDCLIDNEFAVLQQDCHEPVASVTKEEGASASTSESKSIEVKLSGNAEEAILITEQDIKFIQLPPNYSCHLVRISDKLYIISSEISAFLWDEDLVRTMQVRQKGYGYLPKLVLKIDEHLAVMEELAKFKIPGVYVNGEFAKILVLYEVSIVIEILEIFEHQSEELKSELKKHVEHFNANPSKWTASIVPCVGDEDCVTDLSDVRSEPSRCHIEVNDSKGAKEGVKLRKEWNTIFEQRKKLLNQIGSSASPEASASAVEELNRMENQMKLLQVQYDAIRKHLRGVTKQESSGTTDVNFNAKISDMARASAADAKAEKIQSLVATQSTIQKKPRTNTVAPMTQAEPTVVTTDINRNTIPPISQPAAARPLSASLQQPAAGFASAVRPALAYGQQMDSLAQMLSQMTLRNPQLTGTAGLFGLAGIGYQLPNPQLHTPFGYSAAQIVMQQQSYLAALQSLSSLVSSGSSYAQTPYDTSLLGITNLSYLANAAPTGSAMPRANQQGPQQD